MNDKTVPTFAIVGHPNEGKSSVVSTLSEDDSVTVSAMAGETIQCHTFPVTIDHEEIIRFIDTPGFQNPKATLQWMRKYSGPDEMIVRAFHVAHLGNPDFRHDCELLRPVAEGAGIIYVVDGSRPLRQVDKAEMEILRLTGCPRMAIINCKEKGSSNLGRWKSEFRKHFNAVRLFNAHRATYAERIDLLENLKSIDQDWQVALQTVIQAFKGDWEQRNDKTVENICDMLADCLTHSVSQKLKAEDQEEKARKAVLSKYTSDIAKKERRAHAKIRKLFKHNIFGYELPTHSILHEDLFHEKTWQVLGLTRKQLIMVAGATGASAGAILDVAAGGITFGVFTSLAGAASAGWAAFGGDKRLASRKVAGLPLGGKQIKAGPTENIQLLYILIDRALIFYSHVINWAHARRDFEKTTDEQILSDESRVPHEWSQTSMKICKTFFKRLRTDNFKQQQEARAALEGMLQAELRRLSTAERHNGSMTGQV